MILTAAIAFNLIGFLLGTLMVLYVGPDPAVLAHTQRTLAGVSLVMSLAMVVFGCFFTAQALHPLLPETTTDFGPINFLGVVISVWLQWGIPMLSYFLFNHLDPRRK